VAVLVAGGLTNRQIGSRLAVSPRTVGRHVEHLLNKLAVHSRAEIAAWAARRGLVSPAGG
jgi:DNA-binding NarL/FixJ family response regulator